MNESVQNRDENIVYRLSSISKTRNKGGVSFELRIPVFTVPAGQFIALAGPSGCGKSTFLDLLGLVLRPDEIGEFSILTQNGILRELSHANDRMVSGIRRSNLGYVLQSGGLLPYLTVRENIFLPRRLNNLPARMEDIQELVNSLGIAEQLNKKPQHLSGGQRQRVAIARALSHHPSIVLADEPTAAVDHLTAVNIRNKFMELTKKMGVTLLMVTHNIGLVSDIADRTFEFIVQSDSQNHTISTVRERVPASEMQSHVRS